MSKSQRFPLALFVGISSWDVIRCNEGYKGTLHFQAPVPPGAPPPPSRRAPHPIISTSVARGNLPRPNHQLWRGNLEPRPNPPCNVAEHFRQNIAGMHCVQPGWAPKYCRYEFIPVNNWRSGPLRQCIPANIWRELWVAQCIPAIFWLFWPVFLHGVHACNFLAQPGRTAQSVPARTQHPGASCSEGAVPLHRAGVRDVTKATRERCTDTERRSPSATSRSVVVRERSPCAGRARVMLRRLRGNVTCNHETAAPCAGRARGVV